MKKQLSISADKRPPLVYVEPGRVWESAYGAAFASYYLGAQVPLPEVKGLAERVAKAAVESLDAVERGL